jgi:hypothetical protein
MLFHYLLRFVENRQGFLEISHKILAVVGAYHSKPVDGTLNCLSVRNLYNNS